MNGEEARGVEFRELVGESEVRGVWDRGQITQGLVSYKENFGLHSTYDGKTLREVKSEWDMK